MSCDLIGNQGLPSLLEAPLRVHRPGKVKRYVCAFSRVAGT